MDTTDLIQWALLNGRWCMSETGHNGLCVAMFDATWGMDAEFWQQWYGPGCVMLYYTPDWEPINSGVWG